MGGNLEGYIGIGGDIFLGYYLPKLGINYLSKIVAERDLQKAIKEQCGDAGAANEAQLKADLKTALRQPRWDVYAFPRFPFWSLEGGAWRTSLAFLRGRPMLPVFPFMFPLLNIGVNYAAAWSFWTHIPGLRGLSPIANGAYSRALNGVLGTSQDIATRKTFYNNIQCKGDDQGFRGTAEEPKASTATDAAADAAAADATVSAMSFLDEMIWGPFVTPAETPADAMGAGATMAGIPVSSGNLASQLQQMYGTGNGKVVMSGGDLKAGATPLPGQVSLPVMPLVTTAPLTLPAVRPIPIAIPITAGVR